jgi:hypothetical protein
MPVLFVGHGSPQGFDLGSISMSSVVFGLPG